MTIMINNYERMVEAIARFLAAKQMALTKDLYGKQLPTEIWVQRLDQAEALLDWMIRIDREEHNTAG